MQSEPMAMSAGVVATVTIAHPGSEQPKHAHYVEPMGIEQQNLLADSSPSEEVKPKRSKRKGKSRGCCFPVFGNMFSDMHWNRLTPEGKIEFLDVELSSDNVDRVQSALKRLQSANYTTDFECNYKQLELHVGQPLSHVIRECLDDECKLLAARMLGRLTFECGHLNHVMVEAGGAQALLSLMATAESPMMRADTCQILAQWATSDRFHRRLDTQGAPLMGEIPPAEVHALLSCIAHSNDDVIKAVTGYLFKRTENGEYCKVLKLQPGCPQQIAPRLVRLLEHEDAMIRYLAAGALANLTAEPEDYEFKAHVVSLGALEPLVKSLRGHRYGYNGVYLCTSALAARTLQHLAPVEETRRYVAASQVAIPYLLLLLMVNRDTDTVCPCRSRVDHCERSAAGALAELSRDPLLSLKIGEAGAVPALLAMLPTQEGARCCTGGGHWDSYLPAVLRHNPLLALRNLAMLDENKLRFVAPNAGAGRVINQLYSAFALTNDPYREGARPCDLCRNLTISILAKLSVDSGVLNQLSSKQSLVYLVGALRFPDDQCRRDTVVVLTNLCRNDKNKERIADAGGVKAIVQQCLNAKDVELQRGAEQLIMLLGTSPPVRQQIDLAIKQFWESTAKRFTPGKLGM